MLNICMVPLNYIHKNTVRMYNVGANFVRIFQTDLTLYLHEMWMFCGREFDDSRYAQ